MIVDPPETEAAKHTQPCPNPDCQAEITLPHGAMFFGEPKGCRVVTLTIEAICESCSDLIEVKQTY